MTLSELLDTNIPESADPYYIDVIDYLKHLSETWSVRHIFPILCADFARNRPKKPCRNFHVWPILYFSAHIFLSINHHAISQKWPSENHKRRKHECNPKTSNGDDNSGFNGNCNAALSGYLYRLLRRSLQNFTSPHITNIISIWKLLRNITL